MSENNIKRYALCGVSARGIHMFLQPMYRTFPAYTQPVALLDIDPLRFAVTRDNHSSPRLKRSAGKTLPHKKSGLSVPSHSFPLPQTSP